MDRRKGEDRIDRDHEKKIKGDDDRGTIKSRRHSRNSIGFHEVLLEATALPESSSGSDAEPFHLVSD